MWLSLPGEAFEEVGKFSARNVSGSKLVMHVHMCLRQDRYSSLSPAMKGVERASRRPSSESGTAAGNVIILQ